MDATTKKLFECAVVPVIKLDSAEDAVPLCKALLAGGIFVAEVTFRTNAAEEAIKNIAENLPEVFVGAGTVLNVELAKKAVAAGAAFIVTPGFNRGVVEYCLENKIPVFPGVSSPTDIETGLSYGLDVLKFFPAEANGGLKALKAMSAPYGMIKFMPTGGIDAANLAEYLRFDRIVACGGSWMVKDDLIKAGNFAEITRLSEEAVSKAHSFEFAHMAINNGSKEEAIALMKLFGKCFSFAGKEGNSSAFSGTGIEIMYTNGAGDNGHIGIKAVNVARAIAYFERNGIEVDYSTLRGTPENPTFIYLKNQFGGFAVHVIQ